MTLIYIIVGVVIALIAWVLVYVIAEHLEVRE